ncbi:MAG: 30S ribosomal protein S17e [Candidatus Nanoarchaeia archaeon]
MGRIKSTLIKRTARKLVDGSPESFNEDFQHNKEILGNNMPSKRMRNMIAGYITRIKRNTKTILNNE